jgi:ABC-2 type transport system ATP-binding protein
VPGQHQNMTTDSSGGAIVLAGLSKSYGSVTAVRSIDLVIAPGETVAILGPNGAGKTTTIDMILGLTRPDGGEISLFGMPPKRATAAGVVSGMLQTGELIPHLRVREIVTMVASLYPRPLPVPDVLRLTGISDLAERQAARLSGGQSQRVRFAIALVANPDLLLLDEPTAALDVEARQAFWQAVRAVAAEGKTVLFATHYLDEADAYADRIVLLAKGRIVADGSATEIKARASGRTIRATLPGAALAELSALPGAISADRHGDAVILACSDAESALRALLDRFPGVRDIEVRGADLEAAFVALTRTDDERLAAR